MKAFNGIGIVLGVILDFILLVPKPRDGSAPGISDVQHLFAFAIPLPVLMILAYKRVVIDPSERRLRITKGIWPGVTHKEVGLDDSAELQLDATKGQRWTSYSAHLSLQSERKPILLFADGDENQLRSVLEFAGKAGLRLSAKQGLLEIAPDRVRDMVAAATHGR
jgi:hypothetical protein